MIVGFNRGFGGLLGKLTGLDIPILVSVLGRGLNALFVPISVAFIAKNLTPSEQGYYYTFSGVFALQSFLELGFLSCISHVASHNNKGDVSKEADVSQDIKLLIGYGIIYAVGLSIIVFFLIGGLGWLFIRAGKAEMTAYFWPWAAFVLVSCLNIAVSPVMAILDGCSKVKFTSIVRVSGMLASSAMLCLSLSSGLGLYALALGIGSILAVTLGSILWKFPHLLTNIWGNWRLAFARWNRSLISFQGKIALTTVCNYFLGALYAPLLYRLSSADAVGRFGMSLQLMNSIGAISLVWTTTKTGVYGHLAQSNDRSVLLRLFCRTTFQSAVFALAGVSALLALYWALDSRVSVFSRMLPWRDLALLGWPVVVIQFTVAATSLFRAFGEERLLKSVVIHTFLHVALLLVFIPYLGAQGAVYAQVISYTFGLFWALLVFRNFLIEKNISYA